ncbi:MAG TPA: sodium:solute symporter [Acidobacteriota bacterium]|nr:sodium:solute symporter [Acidobacteriota bacterium]
MAFTGLDYLVLFAYLAASAGLGLYVGRGQKDLDDYFLGGGRMPWWAISFSIVATETSTLTFIGAPAISYSGNLTFLQVAMGYCIGKILVAAVLMPGYLRGRIQTAYELLNQRFGGRVRSASALIFQVTRTLGDGVRLFATALVLAVVTQMADVWTILIIAAVTVVYTFYGGMRAVVWNDVVQLAIYIGGALLAFYILLDRIPGGWTEVSSVASAKFQVFDFSLDFTRPLTFWGGMVGGAFLTFATHGADQMMVQRYLTCGNLRGSRVALIFSGVVVLAQFALFLVIGLMLYTFYRHFPMESPLQQTDRVFPLFIVQEMPSGISGLIIAAVFAAAMSTLSSSLNSLASSSVNDYYRPYLVPDGSQSHYLRVSRLFTLAWGGALAAVAFLAKGWGNVLETGLAIASITMGSVLGIFLLGLVSRRAGQSAALSGLVFGLAVMLAIKLYTPLAWTWYVLVGTASTLAAALVLQAVRTTFSKGP